MLFKNYNMWWAQSLSAQGLCYAPFKKTTHIFKGRTMGEARKKMEKFLDMAHITGRFLCAAEGFEPKPVKQKEPVNMLKEQLGSGRS